jgi:prepilin-type N-terminal cleavage/methylation domain-containing protein
MMLNPRKSSAKAFTLLELIVVIVILGLLAALAIPTFARVTKRSQDASTAATLAATLRDARALVAFGGTSWEDATKAAVGETTAPSASGLLAASMTAKDQSAGEPTDSVAVYALLDGGVVLSMLSRSGNVCLSSASSLGTTTPTCAPAWSNDSGQTSAGSVATGGTLSDGTSAPIAPGTAKTGTGSGTGTGTGATTPPASAPSAPSAVSFSNVTASGATAGWGASTANGSPVTGYRVAVTSSSGTTTTTSAGPSATSATLSGLAASSTYTVTVTALSAAGDTASAPATLVTSAPPAYAGGNTVSTVAGTGTAGSADLTGTQASFKAAFEITSYGSTVYVADAGNNKIRAYDTVTGAVTTIAGSGAAGSVDATGTAASFAAPRGVATDGTNLYVADFSNGMVRKVNLATKAVTTLATGLSGPNNLLYASGVLYLADSAGRIATVNTSTGAVSTYATLPASARGLATDGTSIYAATYTNGTILKVSMSTKGVTTLAGSAGAGSADATGTAATFRYPVGLSLVGSKLYVADQYNQLIRVVDTGTGVVSTLAGSAGVTGTANGAGSVARFNYPTGITSANGALYVMDTDNNLLRKIS